jgi:hypothetical protein
MLGILKINQKCQVMAGRRGDGLKLCLYWIRNKTSKSGGGLFEAAKDILVRSELAGN